MGKKQLVNDVYEMGYNRLLQRVSPVFGDNQQLDQNNFTSDAVYNYLNAINVDEVIQYTLTLSAVGAVYAGSAVIPYKSAKSEPPNVFGFVTVGAEPDENQSFLPFYEAVPAPGIDFIMEIANYSYLKASKTGVEVQAFSNAGDKLTWNYVIYVIGDKKRSNG